MTEKNRNKEKCNFGSYKEYIQVVTDLAEERKPNPKIFKRDHRELCEQNYRETQETAVQGSSESGVKVVLKTGR